MSAGEVAAGCEGLLLVRHPSEASVLSEVVAAGQPPVARLPSVLTKLDPDPVDYLPAAHALLGTALALLRANGLAWVDQGEATLLLAETEPFAGPVPDGLEWRALDGAGAALAQPARVLESLGAWVVERDTGWSPLRPPWSRAGWLARAGGWMAEAMTTPARPRPARPRWSSCGASPRCCGPTRRAAPRT